MSPKSTSFARPKHTENTKAWRLAVGPLSMSKEMANPETPECEHGVRTWEQKVKSIEDDTTEIKTHDASMSLLTTRRKSKINGGEH